MCGICGIRVSHDGDEATSLTHLMNDLLVHRGPDDGGVETWGSTAIAMRRLSIIDLATGHQPMHSSDGRHTIVFNGEIYNFRQLRDELVADGVSFRTTSDTEVVLELVRRDGAEAAARLNGMFAFCVLDRDDGSLLLARDEFGQKPLYWFSDGERFVFSSELPSLLADHHIPRKIDQVALAHYLRVFAVPAPLTMIEGVRQLLPGHWMRLRDGEVTSGVTRWNGEGTGDPITSDREALDLVREALVDSVQRHMISDVPLGAFLSGGIDSTAVVAAAMQSAARPIQTFTVRWDDRDYDESPVAKIIAQHLGTDHHEIHINAGGFDPDVFSSVVDHMSQPFGDVSLLPTFLLCKEVRQHLTVALSGDGGDEMFAGYDDLGRYQTLDKIASRVPAGALRSAAKTLDWLAPKPGFRTLGPLRMARRGARVAALAAPERIWTINNQMDPVDFDALCGGLLRPPDFQPIRELLVGYPNATPLRDMMEFRTNFILPDQFLPKVDRMSMASSLEVRAPLLDRRIAAVARRLPDHMLRRDGVGKWALREAIRPWVPATVFDQPKRGFAAPLHSLQNQSYIDLCRGEILDRDHPIMGTFFHHDALRRVVDRALAKTGSGAEESQFRVNNQAFALLLLATWTRRFNVTA